MKKILFTLLLLALSCEFVISQAFESRLIINDYGYLEYQMRETTGTNPPWGDPDVWAEYVRPITDITFTVRWPQSLGDPLEINLLCTQYNIVEGFPNALTHPSESYYYKLFGCDPIPVYPPADTNYWQLNVWQTIATMKISNPSGGTGDFTIAPDGWLVTNTFNFSYDSDEDGTPEDYLPVINSGVTGYPYPTLVFDRVWQGVSAQWNIAGNWLNTCLGTGGIPNSTHNALIPYLEGGTYPSTTTANLACKSLTLAAGTSLLVPSPRMITVAQQTTVNSDAVLTISTTTLTNTFNSIELKASAARAAGQMIINPGAKVTNNGSTILNSPGQLQILASVAGVGSYIDNGTITYNTGGSAVVETYLANGGTYYYHQVGPTVDNLPAGSGVELGDFDVTVLNTFAYEWLEPTQAWLNQSSTTYAVNTANGLLLTTDDGSTGEYAQDGSLINGIVPVNLVLSGDPTPGLSTYGWNLKSNPYAAPLDWNDTWTREDPITTNDLNPTVYVLNNGSSTYASFNAATDVGTGMTKDIQVGQGFWVQYAQNPYVAPGSININLQPGDRNHATIGFLKEGIVDQLTLTSSGNNSYDILAIAFRENGTLNYDRFIDVDKWDSYWEDATEAWTVSGDLRNLTHNILPTLGNGNVSVPLSLECHAAGQYTITASDIESFQGNVDIYLEDLVTGGEWHDLVANPVYTFEGTPGENLERFVVHFFGTAGLNDPAGYNAIRIYAWGQDAYIVNRGKETVKEYVAYDLMGRELHRGTLPNSTVNKVTIGDVSAYYIVKVITKEGRIYTDKVYITK